jgi:hypothetical protein
LKFLTETFWGTTSTPKKVPQENLDYEFVDITLDNEPVSAVRLLREPYVGVTFYYGWVRPQQLVNGDMGLSFEYNIHDDAGHRFGDLRLSQEFINRLGDVLSSIIMNEQNKLESVTAKDSE